MRKFESYVFDSYDDLEGNILQSVADSHDQLPPIIKTATRLSRDQIESLSPDNFALMFSDGENILKKYATIDAGNTALSVIYLLKQAHLLPEDAVKTAANNLIYSCDRYNIPIPEELIFAADNGYSPNSEKERTYYSKTASVSKVRWPFADEPKNSSNEFGSHDASTADVDQRTNINGVSGTNFTELPLFPKEKMKLAEAVTRQQREREVSYFDLSDWDPSKAYVDMNKQATRTLLSGRYPIDSYDQVKVAAEYFHKNWTDFHPRTRHDYCTKLASRMEELGITPSYDISRYGSNTYAADSDMYVEHRRHCVPEEAHDTLDMLLEKRAQVSPETFAEALCEFDVMNKLSWYWGGQIADPWFSTFGPSLEKIAEEDWSFIDQDIRIDIHDLEYIARNELERVSKSFGIAFANEFVKNPKQVFESLPTPNKRVLARFAAGRLDKI